MILQTHTSSLLFHGVVFTGCKFVLYSICLNMCFQPVWLSVLNDENNDRKCSMAVIVIESLILAGKSQDKFGTTC